MGQGAVRIAHKRAVGYYSYRRRPAPGYRWNASGRDRQQLWFSDRHRGSSHSCRRPYRSRDHVCRNGHYIFGQSRQDRCQLSAAHSHGIGADRVHVVATLGTAGRGCLGYPYMGYYRSASSCGDECCRERRWSGVDQPVHGRENVCGMEQWHGIAYPFIRGCCGVAESSFCSRRPRYGYHSPSRTVGRRKASGCSA